MMELLKSRLSETRAQRRGLLRVPPPLAHGALSPCQHRPEPCDDRIVLQNTDPQCRGKSEKNN